MPRVITYTPRTARAHHLPSPFAFITARSSTPDDDYASRLLKYIPAEAVALYAALIAGAAGKDWKVQWLLVGIGALGDVLYLAYHVRRVKPDKRPLPHYWVMSVVAFVVWAASTNASFSASLHLDQFWKGVVLVVTVFAFPLIDDWLADLGI